MALLGVSLATCPYFGGYADASWTSEMKDQVQVETFEFHRGPMMDAALRADPDPTCPGCYPVPPGFPWLDVEMGAGMNVDYNHRTHLEPRDMVALQICTVGVPCAPPSFAQDGSLRYARPVCISPTSIAKGWPRARSPAQ